MPHSATVKHARPQTQGVEAGLLTPPPSQPHEDSIAASSLMSPPPEETLRVGHILRFSALDNSFDLSS